MEQKLRVNLIGAGNIKFHYFNLLEMDEQDFNAHVEAISKALVETGAEIVLLPDRGVCFEVAKKYKAKQGEKVFGTLPAGDVDFGIKHLQQYLNAEVEEKKVIDEIIDTNNWYKQDLTHCIFGDVVLMLGISLGSLGELAYGYYLYKLFVGEKPEVSVMKKKIHPMVRAGEFMPFSVIIYKPFVKEELPKEIVSYVEKLGGKVYYVNDAEGLKEIIDNL